MTAIESEGITLVVVVGRARVFRQQHIRLKCNRRARIVAADLLGGEALDHPGRYLGGIGVGENVARVTDGGGGQVAIAVLVFRQADRLPERTAEGRVVLGGGREGLLRARSGQRQADQEGGKSAWNGISHGLTPILNGADARRSRPARSLVLGRSFILSLRRSRRLRFGRCVILSLRGSHRLRYD